MAELTPEERAKIYAEEKARMEIRTELEAQKKQTAPSTKPQIGNLAKGCLWIFIAMIGIDVIGKTISSTESKPPTVLTIDGKQIDVSKALIGHWETHNDSYYNGDDNLYFSEKKLGDYYGIQDSSIELLREKNADAFNYDTMKTFHHRVMSDPDDDNFKQGPYPYSISVDNKTNTATIIMLDFGNDILRKLVVSFRNSKEFTGIDYPDEGREKGKRNIYKYINNETEP